MTWGLLTTRPIRVKVDYIEGESRSEVAQGLREIADRVERGSLQGACYTEGEPLRWRYYVRDDELPF